MATQPHQSTKKILQPEAQPAKGKMEPKPKTKKAGAAVPAGAEAFTALDLDVAEQLICLRESSGSFSRLRSVDVQPAPPAERATILGACVDWEEEEDDEVSGTGRQRRVKRYLLISEIYAATATEQIGGCSGSSRKNQKKK